MKKQYEMIRFQRVRLSVALALALGVGAIGLVGCGGGGTMIGLAPTRATMAKVHSIQTRSDKSLSLNSSPNAAASLSLNGTATNSPTVSGGGGVHRPVSFLGAFLRGGFGFGGGVSGAGVGSPGSSTSASGGVGNSFPGAHPGGRKVRGRDASFYYDEYLGLWVDFVSTDTSVVSTLFEDQAKTKPAGSITSTFPATFDPALDYSYTSNYIFTAGTLKGSNGAYHTTFKVDGSGSSDYTDTEPDGSKSVGSSFTNADGSSSWKSTYKSSTGFTSNDSGSFKVDGSGKSHFDSSDGYVTDYLYNADGSGSGKIAGPDAGLPATIVWDNMGNVTITYADGSVEKYNLWAFVTEGGTATDPPPPATGNGGGSAPGSGG